MIVLMYHRHRLLDLIHFYFIVPEVQKKNTLSRVRVAYKMGFGLDGWIYCTLYIHTTRDYRQYSIVSIPHTFQFTVAHALGYFGTRLSYNPSALTPRKTPSYILKDACLRVRYLAMNVLLLLFARVEGIC
jgi:hypothetical protein